MSYESLREYLQMLQRQSMNGDTITIDWSAISPDKVRAVKHSQLAGLQVADAVASSMFFAAEINHYGQTEPRHLQMLKSQIYKHANERYGYGLKFWPDCKARIKEMPHLAAFF